MNLINALKKIKNFRQIPDYYWLDKLENIGLGINRVTFDKATGNLIVKTFDLPISKGKNEFFLRQESLRIAQILQRNANAKFFLQDEKDIIAEIEDLKFIIETTEELLILEEVFLTGVYNFIYNQPVVTWDIGMNTGVVSLYFAQRENVKAVFSYEPFEKTYAQAELNFKLNPHLASKLKPHLYGVAADTKSLVVEYDYELKGSVGLEGLRKPFRKDNQTLEKAEIQVKSAVEVLDNIVSQYPGIDIIAKIDCEGSEYEILESLAAANKLNLLRALMIEWHEKGPDQLVEYLQKSGFVIFSRRPKSKSIGMIHAVRV